MEITRKDLVTFANLCGNCGYNIKNKDKYRRAGRRILKAIVEQVGLRKGEFEIRWNAGGVAVDGDHILHTDRFYLALSDNCGLGSFYWRTCRGRKDYTGGPNQNYRWTDFVTDGLQPLVDRLIVAQTGICSQDRADRIASFGR